MDIDFKKERQIITDVKYYKVDDSGDLDNTIQELTRIREEYGNSPGDLSLIVSHGYRLVVQHQFQRPETDEEIRTRFHHQRMREQQEAKQAKRLKKIAELKAQEERDKIPKLREYLNSLEKKHPDV